MNLVIRVVDGVSALAMKIHEAADEFMLSVAARQVRSPASTAVVPLSYS